MVLLKPIQTSTNFQEYPNIKLYPGSLHPGLAEILDFNSQKQLPIKQIWDNIVTTKRITMVRHLESKYNEYKLEVKKDPRYEILINGSNKDDIHNAALWLLQDYRERIWFDAFTDISQEWHKQWEAYGKLYGKLIAENPDLFPTLIVVSPYLRTRLTAHYFLKYIDWLDLDLNKLIDPHSKADLILWTFQGKPIRIKVENRARERDHGSWVAPSFLRKYIESLDPFTTHWILSEDESDASYYFNAPAWWESQVQVEERTRSLLNFLSGEKDANIMIFSHHIAILAALNIIFAGSMNTYFNLDNNRKPQNGSMTILSQLSQTETWQEDKLRVAIYNTLLSE
jgi:broad specificity phosphatase PhoE